jgi:hypothetical protein
MVRVKASLKAVNHLRMKVPNLKERESHMKDKDKVGRERENKRMKRKKEERERGDTEDNKGMDRED